MRRGRGSAGQTTVEWLVVMVGVVGLAAALATALPGAAGTITSTFQKVVCSVSGSSCGSSDGGSPNTGALDPSAPTHGPIIGTNPRNVGAGLPFPGSVSVTVDANKEGDTGGDGAKAGYKVGVSATFERSTSPCSIDGTGTPSVTLSTSADIKVQGGVNGEAKDVGVSITGSIGDKTTYQIKTDPSNADAIEHGDVPPPNPADPRSIPEGSSITLNRDSYKGADGAITYHNITAELGYKDGQRVSSAVQRIDGNTVRVTVGDTDFVENTLGLKVGTSDVSAGFSVGNGFQDGKARSVDLDVSTPAGWQAYQTFIGSGQLPAAGARGTSNPTTSTSATMTHTGSLTGKIGPLGGTAGGTTVTGQIVETKHPDGSSETTAFGRLGDTVAATEYDRDASGNIVDEHYALHLQDVDKHYIDGYQQLTGHTGDASSNRDVTFTYSAADLNAMQDLALDRILAAQRNAGGGPLGDDATRDDLRAYLRDHPSGDGLAPSGGPLDQVITTMIGAAKDPSDVLVALLDSGQGGGTGVMDYLLRLGVDAQRARDTLGSNDTSPFLPGGYQNQPEGC